MEIKNSLAFPPLCALKPNKYLVSFYFTTAFSKGDLKNNNKNNLATKKSQKYLLHKRFDP